MEELKSAIVLVSDLMFRVKIDEALNRAGFKPRFTGSPQDLLKVAQSRPDLIVIDLNLDAARPLDLISELKANSETQHIPLFAYVSHVQTDLRRAAEERGCNQVVARSALIPALLRAGGVYVAPAG